MLRFLKLVRMNLYPLPLPPCHTKIAILLASPNILLKVCVASAKGVSFPPLGLVVHDKLIFQYFYKKSNFFIEM
jgi:hypothetical protein